jgi:hypothetical protein
MQAFMSTIPSEENAGNVKKQEGTHIKKVRYLKAFETSESGNAHHDPSLRRGNDNKREG